MIREHQGRGDEFCTYTWHQTPCGKTRDEHESWEPVLDNIAPGIREMQRAMRPAFIGEHEDWRQTEEDWREYARGWSGL